MCMFYKQINYCVFLVSSNILRFKVYIFSDGSTSRHTETLPSGCCPLYSLCYKPLHDKPRRHVDMHEINDRISKKQKLRR